MANRQTAVIGIYPTHASLEWGVQALKGAGFWRGDISVLHAEKSGKNGSSPMKGEAAAEVAHPGASSDAGVGGVLGWLSGIGSMVIPGMGVFIAAGPIIAAIAGAYAAGVVGGVVGALVGLGVSPSEANEFQQRLMAGGALLSVHPVNGYRAKHAREIMESTGAQNISSTG